MKGSQIRTPSTLNSRWTPAACAASRGLPMAANIAVTHVPMFAPNASVMPASRVMKPCEASTITIPVVAAELCTIAVKPAATRIPSTGLSMLRMVSMNGSYDRREVVASLMNPMPRKIIPSPRIMPP